MLNQLAELELRKRRAVVRPVALGRERLAARVQRLPSLTALLQAPAQHLDEAGERLRRGLGERIAIARTALQRDAARLSLPLIRARVDRARDRVDALVQMLALLDYKQVLRRGYAIVRGAAGQPVMSATQAGAEAALELEFADGRIRVGSAASSPTPKPTTKPGRQPGTPADQWKLL